MAAAVTFLQRPKGLNWPLYICAIVTAILAFKAALDSTQLTFHLLGQFKCMWFFKMAHLFISVSRMLVTHMSIWGSGPYDLYYGIKYSSLVENHMGVYTIWLGLELLSSSMAVFIFTRLFKALKADESTPTQKFRSISQHPHHQLPYQYRMALVVISDMTATILFYWPTKHWWPKVPLSWILPLSAYLYLIRKRYKASAENCQIVMQIA